MPSNQKCTDVPSNQKCTRYVYCSFKLHSKITHAVTSSRSMLQLLEQPPDLSEIIRTDSSTGIPKQESCSMGIECKLKPAVPELDEGIHRTYIHQPLSLLERKEAKTPSGSELFVSWTPWQTSP